MKYEIKEVDKYHFVIEFEDIGFIEYWQGNRVIYTNIFENGLSMSIIKKIIKKFKKYLFFYKIGLLKRK